MELAKLILASAVVSGIVSFLLKFFFENKQQRRITLEIEQLKHNLLAEQEKLKSHLESKESVISSINEEKLNLYPKFCETVYRTRNFSRKLVEEISDYDTKNELASKTIEIENLLYQHRIYLENDGIFYLVHSYKNLQNSFLKICQQIDFENVIDQSETLRNLFNEIDKMYLEIVEKFNEKLNQLKE